MRGHAREAPIISHARVGPNSQPLLLCSHAKIHHSLESLQQTLHLSSFFSFFSIRYPTHLSLSTSIHPLEFTVEAASRPLMMLPLRRYLLLPLLLVTGGGVHCLQEKVLPLQDMQWRENSPSPACSPQRSRREKSSTILEMKHHSYFFDPMATQEDKLWKILISDEARVSSLESQIKQAGFNMTQEGASEAQIPLSSGIKLQTLNYIVTVELGGWKMSVVVDTGSDITWVQCKPCTSCYNQQDPLFDPSASPSYQAIPCNSPTCNSLQLSSGISGICSADQPSCSYALSYGDGSYTHGALGWEHINLGGTIVEGFVFGCGRSNHGLFGRTSGLMGLGRSQLSLVSQTTAQFGGVFSYCLPTREYDSSGSLTFGGDSSVYKNSTPIIYTRMISDPQQTLFYYLNLTGMSISGVALQDSGFSGGKILIDSGTVISRLAPSVYNALKTEILKQFSRYPLAPSFSILDTCFNFSGYKEVNIPTLKFQFEGGVEVDVDASGVFYFVKADASQVCLALAGLSYEDEVGIIGNYQQKNLRVVYDTVGSRLGFAQETCGYS